MLSSVLSGIKTAVAGADDDDVEVETGVAHPDCCDVRSLSPSSFQKQWHGRSSDIQRLDPGTVRKGDCSRAATLKWG